jgi:hypothetical protein
MPWANPTQPNLTDFTEFVGEQFTSVQLPPNSPWLGYALNYALARVSTAPCIPGPQYTLAVYSLGMHWLIKWAPDQGGQTAFATARTNYKLLDFVAGVISGTSDNGTSSNLAVPESFKNLPLSALDCLKTPWGRSYLEYQQSFGPNVFGVS